MFRQRWSSKCFTRLRGRTADVIVDSVLNSGPSHTEVLMRRSNVLIALPVFCLLCTVLAYSDNISTFQTSLADLSVTSSLGTFDLSAALAFGAGAISVQGLSAPCALCVSGVEAGTVVPLTPTIESGTGSATIDGVQYNNLFFHGFLELGITPPKVTLPSGGGTSADLCFSSLVAS